MARVEPPSTKTRVLQMTYIVALLIFLTSSISAFMYNVITSRYSESIHFYYPELSATRQLHSSTVAQDHQRASFMSISSLIESLRPGQYVAREVGEVLRVQHHLRKISYYDGSGKGNVRITHFLVSLVGIVGMFAAVTGALLAPWLAQAGNTVTDDDEPFAYWMSAREPDEEEDDEHVQLLQRSGAEEGTGNHTGAESDSESEESEDGFGVVVHNAEHGRGQGNGDEGNDGGDQFRRAFGPHREAKFAMVRVMDVI